MTKKKTKERLAYTVDEASDVANIGRSSLYEDIAAGKLEARKRGRRTVITRKALLTYLDQLPRL